MFWQYFLNDIWLIDFIVINSLKPYKISVDNPNMDDISRYHDIPQLKQDNDSINMLIITNI